MGVTFRIRFLSGLVVLFLPCVRALAAPAALEEIHVQARHRTESVQKVPISVGVVNVARAKLTGRNDLRAILNEEPSADFRTNSSPKDRTIFIRGIGTISTSPGVEPSVSTVIDGVPLARSGQASLDLFDAQSIDVLRGPQGTLFGLNASAGVVNITTPDPTYAFRAYTDAAYYGGGGEWRTTDGVSGGITETLSGRIDVLASEYGGNIHDTYGNSTLNGYETDAIRTKLVWRPGDDWKLTLAADYQRSTEDDPNGVFTSTEQIAYPTGSVSRSPTLASALGREGVFPSGDNTSVGNNVDSRSADNNGGMELTTEKKFGAYTLTSITAYRSWQDTQWQDYDQLSAPSAGLPQVGDRGDLQFNQVSEEARIASPKGHFIDYVAGFFYLHDQDVEQYSRLYQPEAGSSVFGNSRYGTVENNEAIFGEANLNFTKNFRAIAGVRLLHDDLDFHFNHVSTAAVAVTGIRPDFTSSGATNADGIEDRFGLQWDITPTVIAYATYSRGFKGPAYNVFFNMQATDTDSLKPETSDDYEAGIKTRFLGGRGQFNFDAFIENFSNFQANFLDSVAGGLVTRLINAGSVTTRGFEGDLRLRPVRNLTLDGAATYDDAYVQNFNCPAGSPASCNVDGAPLPFAPRWKLNLGADQAVPLNERYRLDLGTDFVWQTATQYSLNETPQTVQGDYGIWDADASVNDSKLKLRVSAVARNLLNRHYSSYVADGNLAGIVRFVPRDDGRYFGVEVRKEF